MSESSAPGGASRVVAAAALLFGTLVSVGVCVGNVTMCGGGSLLDPTLGMGLGCPQTLVGIAVPLALGALWGLLNVVAAGLLAIGHPAGRWMGLVLGVLWIPTGCLPVGALVVWMLWPRALAEH